MCDAMGTADQPSSTQANTSMFKFLDVLIREVKKRPILWDKKSKLEHYGNRRKVTEEWKSVASILNKSIEEVKTKWRNLRDTFHREEKKTQVSSSDGSKPLLTYTGQWDKFEKLIFLYNTRSHTRSNEEYIEASEPEICIDNIKEELDLSEHSNDPLLDEEDRTIVAPTNNSVNPKVNQVEKTNTFPTVPLEIDLNLNADQNSNNYQETRRKRTLDDSSSDIAFKKRTTESTSIETDIDEDMLVQSLVPFLRKLNPIRKLIVRNELQNLLLKEMLCDHCRTRGLRPDCKCNYN